MTRSKVTDAECQTPKENSTKVDWRKCMDENDITLDYVSWVYLPAGWQKSHERANGVRRQVNMLNFLNFFFSSIKYPLLFQNISSFFSNFRIKVQSRGRAFLEQFVLVFFISCDCQFFSQTCRFSLLSFDCYCCGAFFHYTEHVRIETDESSVLNYTTTSKSSDLSFSVEYLMLSLQGKICTRYCLKENSRWDKASNNEKRKLSLFLSFWWPCFFTFRGFCKPVLIVLPNNWGDPIPDKVHKLNRYPSVFYIWEKIDRFDVHR